MASGRWSAGRVSAGRRCSSRNQCPIHHHALCRCHSCTQLLEIQRRLSTFLGTAEDEAAIHAQFYPRRKLCSRCAQKEELNIPVYFSEERRKREIEEEKLRQHFANIKDAEDQLKEQEDNLAARREQQKVAAFNLGVAEAKQIMKMQRNTEFKPSYIFQKRPLTSYYRAQDEIRANMIVAPGLRC